MSLARHQRRQRVRARRADFVHAVADLGRDERQTERGVDLLLGRRDRSGRRASLQTLRPERHPRSAAMAARRFEVRARAGERQQRRRLRSPAAGRRTPTCTRSISRYRRRAPAMQRAGRRREAAGLRERGSGILERREDLDVADRSCPRRSEPPGLAHATPAAVEAVRSPAARGSSPGRAECAEPPPQVRAARRRSPLRFARRSLDRPDRLDRDLRLRDRRPTWRRAPGAIAPAVRA